MKFCVETSLPWHPGGPHEREEFTAESVEEIGQFFERRSECLSKWTLSAIVEELASAGCVQYQNPESGRTVLVRILEDDA